MPTFGFHLGNAPSQGLGGLSLLTFRQCIKKIPSTSSASVENDILSTFRCCWKCQVVKTAQSDDHSSWYPSSIEPQWFFPRMSWAAGHCCQLLSATGRLFPSLLEAMLPTKLLQFADRFPSKLLCRRCRRCRRRWVVNFHRKLPS